MGSFDFGWEYCPKCRNHSGPCRCVNDTPLEICIKCGALNPCGCYKPEYRLLSEVNEEDGPKKCKCGKADSRFCLVCNRECPACHSKMYNGVCVYCDGKDYSHM